MLEIYFDGSCAPINPNGDIGIGVVVKKDNIVIDSYSKKITRKQYGSTTTNNLAEYMAFHKALELVVKYNEISIIKGDSDFVIKQMSGLWKISQKHIKPYTSLAILCYGQYQACRHLVKELMWIPRELNSEADKLSTSGDVDNDNVYDWKDYELGL